MARPTEDRKPLAIRTIVGPVGLRQPRQAISINVEGGGPRKVAKGWLKDQRGEGIYQKAVKQAMMIGAEQVKLFDADDVVAGQQFTNYDVEQSKAKVQMLLEGREKVSVLRPKKVSLLILERKEDRKRETLVKFGKACHARRERSFIIDNGELLVYRDNHPNAKLKAHYSLKDATCFYETRNTSQVPRWDTGFEDRLRVDCLERQTPLFLYSTDKSKVQRWKRAFTLAKVLISENDRRALKVSIGRATAAVLVKAWNCLSLYYHEMVKTRDLVKTMALRLMKVDISRGWTKIKLVYRKEEEKKRQRKEQQIWAARFMSEKLTKLGKQNAKEPDEVREGVITRIQQTFRRYREDMIFDRMYPLGANMMSRVQQAKIGKLVDCAMSAATQEEALRLTLLDAAFSRWDRDRDTFKFLVPQYSEGNLPMGVANLYVADNLTSLSIAVGAEASEGYSALNKADWNKFVNLSQISSVILHADPGVGDGLAKASSDSGVWCTINGPRIAWDKRLLHKLNQKRELVPEVVGSKNGLEVPKALATGEPVRWVKLALSLTSAQLPKRAATEDASNSDAEYRTVAVVHLLGWSFQSEPATGINPEYRFKSSCQAAIPVAGEEFVCLDSSEVSIEIYEQAPDASRTLLFIGSESLVTLFNAPGSESGVGMMLHEALFINAVQSYSFRLYSQGAAVTKSPDRVTTEKDVSKASVLIDIVPSRTAPQATSPFAGTPVCVSPELVGGGVTTSLYSSHRLAWYDPELGPGKFRVDHVANFAEICLESLRLPDAEKVDDDKLYFVRFKMNGVTVNSPALHKPKASWSAVLGSNYTDRHVIQFAGHRLLLPLPPGCWGPDAAHLRHIDIEVWRKDDIRVYSPLDYKEFMSTAGQGDARVKPDELIYKAHLTFDKRTLVNMQRPVSAFLTKPDKNILSVDVFGIAATALVDQEISQGLLNMDFCLRDRDHAKAYMGQSGEQRALSIGDKAMLIIEEPFLYPNDSNEFRRRFCRGDFDPKKSWGDKMGAPLREPCLSSEYAASGLGELVPKVPFKQGFIPTFCEDIMPHKYVLPLSEKEFLDRHLPGTYPRIVEDMQKHGKVEQRTYSVARRPVVTHLTHINRHVPVVLIATYADGTCDIEVCPEFVAKWVRSPHRKYGFPGVLCKSAPTSGNTPPRVMLKQVPITMLSPVQYTGINIYDSLFKSTEDLLKAAPPENDFDPRSHEVLKPGAKKESTKFKLAAGPLPADASPAACRYEFSLRVRFPNEYEMHQFVAMLRRVVRVDHFQQASKMLEYQRKTQEQPLVKPVQHGHRVGGQLDVVLVEARRLMPMKSVVKKAAALVSQSLFAGPNSTHSETVATKGFQLSDWIFTPPDSDPDPSKSDQPLDEKYLPELTGTASGDSVKCTPEGRDISTFVNFRMLHNKEVIPVRGQKVQQSPIIAGTDSPNWAKKEELAIAGGWTFRTGIIDPDKLPKLIIDFEVMRATIGPPQRIGVIQLPVTEEQFLTNPNKLFKNLWLPLVSVKEGELTPNVTGEIHIMTRWLPATSMQVMADGKQKQQVSVRSLFQKEIWQKVTAMRVREPIYHIEARYLSYNPNLVRARLEDGQEKRKIPEVLKEFNRRHVEDLANTVPYLECLERRQLAAWDEFEASLKDSNLAGKSLGECTLLWTAHQDQEALQKLHHLVMRGVPSSRRHRIWAELTFAKRVAAQDGTSGQRPVGMIPGAATDAALSQAADQEYQTLLNRGLPQNSDAMLQLQEDALILSSWETTNNTLPEAYDFHMKRIKRAKNVVTALLAIQDGGIAYCESLLVLAFFLLLPQGYKDERMHEENSYLFHPTESQVFWLLYTLICTHVNGVYRDYFGLPPHHAADGTIDVPALCAGGGAMQDVAFLECCVAFHENDVWQRMNALGFQLSTVFYGCFMRLFATYMPTATVFRFWDALLAQSTNTKAVPHGRAYLINLAFAVIRCKRPELLKAESALEMKSLLLGVMGSLYDTTTVIDMITAADFFLWGGGGYGSGKVGHLWTQREELFKGMNTTIKSQNEVLKQLSHLIALRFKDKPSKTDAVGCTTQELVSQVIPTIQSALEALRQRGSPRYWAMHRPMPLATRMLAETPLDKAWLQLSTIFLPPAKKPPVPFLVGPNTTASRSPGLEPLDVTASDFLMVLQRELPGWGQHATAMWQVFTNRPRGFTAGNPMLSNHPGSGNPQLFGGNNDPYSNYGSSLPTDASAQSYNAAYGGAYNDPLTNNYSLDASGNTQPTALQKFVGSLFGYPTPTHDQRADPHQGTGSFDERISLNELYAALICASRGTLTDKAAALFNIYSYSDPQGKDLNHMTPVSRLARNAAANVVAVTAEISRALAPMDIHDPEAKHNALCFTVMTNYGSRNTVMGYTFIQSLSPFISTTETPAKTYNIWGTPQVRGLGNKGNANVNLRGDGDGNSKPKLVCIGEISMSINWTPKIIQKPHVGTLNIHLKHIKFFPYFVSDHFSTNPWVEVQMCKEDGSKAGAPRTWAEIERFDPRGVRNTGENAAWYKQGAYGGLVRFDSTMKERAYGHANFTNYIRHGDQGYRQDKEQWEWNDVWGNQTSKEIQVPEEFVQISQRRNMMDIAGVRLLTGYILQRCMLNLTNRQAILLADSAFNRSGAVPGILEAIITTGSEPVHGRCLSEIKDDLAREKRPFVDVTDKIVLEHERQIAWNGGRLNLFHPDMMQHLNLNLREMNMTDPYPGQPKVLYVRFIKAGTGERKTQGIIVFANGDVPTNSVPGQPNSEICLDNDPQDDWPHSKVTKEEFIACITSSPLLGESMRRLGAIEHRQQQRVPIPVEVMIMDPQQEEGFKDLEEAMNVQQSLLIEVWDSDMLGKDFLGEAWLPPLSNFGPRPKDIVLPLLAANFSDDAENGSSRPDPDKKLGDVKKDPNLQITGEIFLTVTWKYPFISTDGLDLDVPSWLAALESLGKYPPNTLTNFKDAVLDKFSSVKDISQKMVKQSQSGKDMVVTVSPDFFNLVGITDKKVQPVFQKWFQEKLINEESIAGRAKKEELRHTGELTIRIEKATRLRRADAKKMGDCDPKAAVWVRNDARGAWHKKPLLQTQVIRNERNPRWQHEEKRMLLSGQYEAKFKQPTEGFGAEAGKLIQTRSTRRQNVQERALTAVKRFGATGLRIKFAGQSQLAASASGEAEEGVNHGMEVILGDSVHEFKEKLRDACRKEAQFWKQRKGIDSEQFNKYVDVEICQRHLVMAYVPSNKVIKMKQAGLENSPEFKHAQQVAFSDPSSWEPLDLGKTFSQYVSRFGFGKQPQILKIVEATESYKAVNLRYKQWADEQQSISLQDINDKQRCYAWARYVHKEDGNSVEWRPALVGKGSETGMVKVQWAFDPRRPVAADQGAPLEMDLSSVLLAPRMPLFNDMTHPAHVEFLEQARLLRSSGKTDWEIEAVLNKLLDDKWEETKKTVPAQELGSKPLRITVETIKMYFIRKDEQALGRPI